MDLQERLRRAGGSAEELVSVLFDTAKEVLLALLDNPRLSDDHVKVLLSRKDLTQPVLRELGARERLLRTYAVKVAFVRHPRAPRNVALPLLRQLYIFDQLTLAATPSTPAELRRLAEDLVINRLPALSLGERLSIVRQGTTRIATALLADLQPDVFRRALDNPRLTEEGVLRALKDASLQPAAVEAIAEHPRWSLRYEVRLALIRNPATSLRRVLILIEQVRWTDLAALAGDRRMPADRRRYLQRMVNLGAQRALRSRMQVRARQSSAGSGTDQMA